MCIAVCKPMGVELPSDEILRNCFYNNPDGAGFAFNLNNEVIIKKGYMNINDFLVAIHDCDKKYHFKNRGVLIHTRIATHGGTNPQMTHPFPICSDEGALKKIEYKSPYAVIHNGIISLTSEEANKKNNMSDTAVFISKYLTKIANNDNWFNKKSNFELIENLIDSKMAILNNRGKIQMTEGFTEDNGVFYSNSSYKENYFPMIKSSDYTKYFNDYEEDVEAMMLKPREVVIFTDGTVEEYSEDIHFFESADGDIYASYDEIDFTNNGKIEGYIEYIGEGHIVSENLKIKEYSPDCILTLNGLYEYI